MSVVVILVSLKTVRFSCKNKSENTFEICLPKNDTDSRYFDFTKLSKLFRLDNSFIEILEVDEIMDDIELIEYNFF